MSREFDTASAEEVVAAVLAAEERVLPAVRSAAAEVGRAADLLAAQWRAGGRWLFVGAGTSGRIAWSQAAELPGTFGLPGARVLACIAGGVDNSDSDEDGSAEDDLGRLELTGPDVVIAVAASGSTPYTLDAARIALTAGAAVVSVTTVPGSALAALAAVAIEAVVGDEALRGSTRLGAGTAQKLVLDALTTAAAARLGRVHGDLMVDVVGANAKLRVRSAGIVAEIAGVDPAAARDALEACGGNARAAVLVLTRGLSPASAAERAARFETLRAAMGTGS